MNNPPNKTQQPCLSCVKHQQLSAKYLNLIALLKIKLSRHSSSKICDPSIPSLPTMVTESQRNLVKIKLILSVLNRMARRGVEEGWWRLRMNLVSVRSTPTCSLLLYGHQNKRQKTASEDTQTTDSLAIASWKSMPQPRQRTKKQSSLFNQTVITGNQHKQLFSLQAENRKLKHLLELKDEMLLEMERRQHKEIVKKSETLTQMAAEINQKNQVVEQLKMALHQTEGELRKNGGQLPLMLQPSSAALQTQVTRLQGVNDKLNRDIQRLKQEKASLSEEIKNLLEQRKGSERQIKQLKQDVFALQHLHNANITQKKELGMVSDIMTAKMQRLKKIQRKLSMGLKTQQLISPQNLFENSSSSQKKVRSESAQTHLQKQVYRNNLQQKIQEIFTFLFNITNRDFQLHSAQLFDEDQKNLLLSHKQRWLQELHMKEHMSPIINQINTKTQKRCDAFSESVYDMFVSTNGQNFDPNCVQSDSEKKEMVQKIGQLKQKQLHVRSVILSLLKSLENKSIKKQTESIISVIADIFEYSQRQRELIAASKQKRLFGFI